MSRKKSQAFSDLITGVFMLSVLALLGYFTIVISGVDLVTGKERIRTLFTFSEVGGLKDHDAVMYRGTKVGSVEKIEITQEGVKVRLEIDKAVVLRKSGKASVCNLSLLGGNYLLLEEGEGEVIDLATATDLKGETPTDWMRDLSKITKNLDELTSSADLRAAITNVNAAIASVKQAVSGIEGSIDEAKATMASIKKTFDNTSQITDELKAANVVDDVKNGIAEIKSGFSKLKEEKVLENLKDGIAAFKKACEGFDFSESKGDVQSMVAEAKDIMAGAKKLVASLNEVSERIKNGDSTIGKLMSEGDMYKEIEGLVIDCRQILDNYRDTTPITTFSSLATGAL